jgi:hypothetical protein
MAKTQGNGQDQEFFPAADDRSADNEH